MSKSDKAIAAMALGSIAAMFGTMAYDASTRDLTAEEVEIIDRKQVSKNHWQVVTDKGTYSITGLSYTPDSPKLMGGQIAKALEIGDTYCMETEKQGAIGETLFGNSWDRTERTIRQIKTMKPGVECKVG